MSDVEPKVGRELARVYRDARHRDNVCRIVAYLTHIGGWDAAAAEQQAVALPVAKAAAWVRVIEKELGAR